MSVNSSITPSVRAARNGNGGSVADADLPFVSSNADTQSGTILSLTNAGQRVGTTLGNILRQWMDLEPRERLVAAASDFGDWLAQHGSCDSITVVAEFESPRVLITLIDRGTATPDLHHFRPDVALIYRVLGPYVVGWSCTAEQGTRTTLIYGDVSADKPPEGWQL